ncbi:hypothetical protein BDY24DRAFT_441535 [Mrakia frigida]|uniref:uncharacterized protein n=1 Tax=Mrakia frigida TaxID=29902 RepID=UPI003FCBF33E
MKRNRPRYTHIKLRRRSLWQKCSDLCEKLMKPTPPVAAIDFGHLFPTPHYFSPPAFVVPPSSLPPRTKGQTKSLLALLPLLETAYLSGDNELYHKQLAKLKKLDCEVGKDFEKAIWEARNAGFDRGYLGFVRRGLDGRNKWQGRMVFSWLGYKSEVILPLIESLPHVVDLVQARRLPHHDIDNQVVFVCDRIDPLDVITSDDLARIWTMKRSLEEKKELMFEMIKEWKSAVQIRHSLTPISPSSFIKTSSLLAYLPFLPFHKSPAAKLSTSQKDASLELTSVAGTIGGSSVAAGTIRRSEYSSGDDSKSLESFDQEDSVFEFRFESDGEVNGSLAGSGRD